MLYNKITFVGPENLWSGPLSIRAQGPRQGEELRGHVVYYLYTNEYNCVCGAREFVVPAHFPLGLKSRAEENSCRGQVAKVQMA